ncbi:MAG: hypothetical protein JWM71_2273 [Solirubrobacteraceae bacterium]|nr:hypothetical protein [Solirubrobacteraceae bacterium]
MTQPDKPANPILVLLAALVALLAGAGAIVVVALLAGQVVK